MKVELNTENNGFKDWFGESILIKLLLIGLLTIVLLIPSSWIQSIIAERQNTQNGITDEISKNWSAGQLIEGPVLILPYKKTISIKDNEGKVNYKDILSNIYIMPEQLNIISDVQPQILHRGIFDAVVYNAKIAVKGKFSALELKKSGINPEMIEWDKAKVDIGISDLNGMKTNPEIKVDHQSYSVEPDFTSLKLFNNNLIISPDLSAKKATDLDFSFDLDIKGSGELHFLHIGKNTVVKIAGKWNNPSFTGAYLPETREITDSAFTATWKMPYFNRPYAQQWEAENTTLNFNDKVMDKSDTTTIDNGNDASFGVKFILPVDQYQKTMRTAKYAILIILLTFISLLFTEMLQKRKVHLLQYVLIGAAMLIYYNLLLSFSERVGFNWAYLIASVSTIALIGLFIAALLKKKSPAFIFSFILSVFYGFIFVIIQLQDMALLCGSIGLFIIVAALMYLSAKIDWNKKPVTED